LPGVQIRDVAAALDIHLSLVVAQVIGKVTGGGAERLAYNLGLGLKTIGVCSICIAVRSPSETGARTGGPIDVIGLAGQWRRMDEGPRGGLMLWGVWQCEARASRR
jgi:hypothetical protein